MRRRARSEKDQTAVRSDPVFTVARLQEIIDHAMRQALVRAIVRESVAVKPRKPISGAKPQEPTRVSDNLINFVVGRPSAME